MEQHPIPQNVSSYQFKLVGDMTLKQFFQVAGGVLGGMILYSSPLLPIIKYPLALLVILLGVGLAFLPLEERPLEKWIFAFFRAIYQPTIFNWKKGAVSSRLFQEETTVAENNQQDAVLKDFLSKASPQTSTALKLDKAEGNFLTNLLGISKTVSTPLAQPQVQPVIQNNPPATIPGIESLPPLSTPTPLIPLSQPGGAVNTPVAVEISATPNVPDQPQPTPPAKQEISIPQNVPTEIPKSQFNVPEARPYFAEPPKPAVAAPVAAPMSGTNIISTTQALFSVDAAPPTPSTYPNVVVGQVIDQDRRIVEGAIIEIRDSLGRPIRALRSNKAGHFITVTPLDNGKYEIITEKDGYEFSPVTFEVLGSIIPPILVQGKRLSQFLDMPAVPVKPIYSIN